MDKAPVNLPQSSGPQRLSYTAPSGQWTETKTERSVFNIDYLPETQSHEPGPQIDMSRLFYHPNGAFKHDWSLYEIDHSTKRVIVMWPGGMQVVLHEHAALQFLRITKSRYRHDFQRHLEELGIEPDPFEQQSPSRRGSRRTGMRPRPQG